MEAENAHKANGEYCFSCEKKVYLGERLEITASGQKRVYHKSGCFRCAKCSRQLSATNYALYNGTVMCKPHHREAFLSKGRYDTPLQDAGESNNNPSDSKAADENAGECSPESPSAEGATSTSPVSPTNPPAFEDIRLSSRTSVNTSAPVSDENALAPPRESLQPTPTLPGGDIARSRSPARFAFNAPAGDKCFACEKHVYPAERVELTVNGQQRVYHKATCIRCAKCNCLLSATKFALYGPHVMCKTHQREAFLQKGKYGTDESVNKEPSGPAAAAFDAKESPLSSARTASPQLEVGAAQRESATRCSTADVADATPTIQVEETAAAAGAEPADAKQQQQVGSLRASSFSKNLFLRSQQAQSVVPAEEPRPRSPAPAANRPHLQLGAAASTGADQCFVCSKRVYPNEKLELTVSGQTRLYHRTGCLKCAKCSCSLSGTNFALYGQQVMCKTHQREAFLLKGKYGQPEEGAAAAPTNAVASAEEQPVASTAEAAETPAPSEVQAEVEQFAAPAGEAQAAPSTPPASAARAEGAAGEEPADVPIPAVSAEGAAPQSSSPPAASSDTMATAAEGAETAAPAVAKDVEVNALASPPLNPEIPEGTLIQPLSV